MTHHRFAALLEPMPAPLVHWNLKCYQDLWRRLFVCCNSPRRKCGNGSASFTSGPSREHRPSLPSRGSSATCWPPGTRNSFQFSVFSFQLICTLMSATVFRVLKTENRELKTKMNDRPERRVAVRWDSSQQTPCHFATLERIAARWAGVLNVSLQGIGLSLPCDLAPGKELIVELPCRDPVHSQAIVAHVVHCKPLSSGNWAVGCTFARPLSREELDALL